jgi:hypothetical protein
MWPALLDSVWQFPSSACLLPSTCLLPSMSPACGQCGYNGPRGWRPSLLMGSAIFKTGINREGVQGGICSLGPFWLCRKAGCKPAASFYCRPPVLIPSPPFLLGQAWWQLLATAGLGCFSLSVWFSQTC